jgi:predicted DNA-binding transcriptional regulator AlpA
VTETVRYLRIRHLRQRYAISDMTVWRRVKAGTFPAPTLYDGRDRLWSVAVLDAYDAEQVAKSAERKATAKGRADAALARRTPAS